MSVDISVSEMVVYLNFVYPEGRYERAYYNNFLISDRHGIAVTCPAGDKGWEIFMVIDDCLSANMGWRPLDLLSVEGTRAQLMGRFRRGSGSGRD